MSVKRSFIAACTIIIMALILCACSGGDNARVSEITGVKYNPETLSFDISATFDSADVREFRGETIYLIEVPADRSVADIVTLIPVAQAKSGAEMSFSVPLRDGARTTLYSGFVLAYFDQASGYVALSDVRYADSPEDLAANKSAYPEYSSIKGLSIVSSSDAVATGTKHTVIRVPIEDYILSEGSEGSLTSIFDGNSYYYSSDKVNELDYKIKNLTGSGIEVILEFTLDTPPEALPEALACLASKAIDASDDADSAQDNEGKHYAISASSGDSYRYIAAFFEFIAERYTRADGKYGFAGSFIIGHGVNSLTDTNIDDARTLTDSAERYAKLLRIAYSALCSKYANGRVFLSLDNKWTLADSEDSAEGSVQNPALPVLLRSSFGGAEYYKALSEEIEKGGAFDFGIALIPSASDGSSSVWNDIGATNDSKTKYLTVKNLSVARALIGEDRNLMIYDYGISSEDPGAMAASYAFAYLKAYEANVTAFIYNGQWDGATGNGATGLMTVGEDGGAADRREIYEVYANIDVFGAGEPESVKLRIGEQWNVLWEKLGEMIGTAHVTETDGLTVKNESDKKLSKAAFTTLFDFSSGETFDFFPSDSTEYIESADYLGTRVLKSSMIPKYKGEYMGVRSAPISYELIDGALQIAVIMSGDSGEGNTALVTLALMQNGEKKSVFHTSSVNIQSSNRQTVYFDVSKAGLDPKLGDVTLYIWVSSSSSRSPVYFGEEAEEQLLYIENITAYIERSSRGAVMTVIVVIAALLIVLGLLFIFLRGRNSPTGPRGGSPQRRPVGGSGQRMPGARPPSGRPMPNRQMPSGGPKGAQGSRPPQRMQRMRQGSPGQPGGGYTQSGRPTPGSNSGGKPTPRPPYGQKPYGGDKWR